VLEDPWNAPPEDAYAWTNDPAQAPAEGMQVVLNFERGIPSMDGARGAAFLSELNRLAGANGVGRIDMIEDRVVGLKSREVYECPGSVTLIEAHVALERLVLTREELRLKAPLDQRYGELIYDGQWSSPLRDALDAFNGKIAERLTGEVRVQLIRGRAVVTGARSPFALYDESLATYGNADRFKHDAATGFIEIWGLPIAAGAAKAADAAQHSGLVST
jgi:argininosuccinate synthase